MAISTLWRALLPLLAYGALKEFKPTEPFLYEFEHLTLNISKEVLSSEVYPIWTYTYLVALIPIFLLTDILLYKPVIIFELFCYIATWLLLDVGTSVLTQQFVELAYGFATASGVAYFSYIYVTAPKDHFKSVTSYVRGALLVGRFSSYAVSQAVILLEWGTYRTLNYISTASLVLALPFALLLPTVRWQDAHEKRFSKQVAKAADAENGGVDVAEAVTYGQFVKRMFATLWRDGRAVYSDAFTVKWSLWWALNSCLMNQILNYEQSLWGTVQTEHSGQYNGFTEALTPLVSLPVVLAMQRVELRWSRWGELLLAVLSIGDAGLLFLQARTSSVFVMYAGYIVYRTLFEAMITIAQFNLADRLRSDSFGLVFGLNTFVALALQSLLTYIVADKHGPLALKVTSQYLVYAGVHVCVSFIFAVAAIITLCRSADDVTAAQPVVAEREKEEDDDDDDSSHPVNVQL